MWLVCGSFVARLLHFLDVFLVVLLDVLQEFLALKDFDVGGEADDEAAGSFNTIDGGVEDPFAVFALEILFGQREFLQEEILGAGVKLIIRRSHEPL